jgi:nitrogen fixation protein FixH
MKKSMYWPVGLIVFFIIFILMNVATVVFFSLERVDLVANNYYEKSIKYQDQIERIKRAQKLAEPIKLKYLNEQEILVVAYPSIFETKGVAGTITFYRPSDALMDETIPIAVDENCSQIVKTSHFARGLWRAKVSFIIDSLEYYYEEMVVL